MSKLAKPPPKGHLLLEREKSGKLNRELFIVFHMLRVEGVTDNDILSWWNLTKKEQLKVIQRDILIVKSFTKIFIKKMNHRLDDIYRYLEMVFPIFIQYTSETIISATSPLPYELRFRVREYFDKRSIDELNNIKASLEHFPNMNAYVRHLIKKNIM